MFSLSALDSIRTENGLKHAVLESIFSDSRAHKWQAVDFGSDNQRGWWGKTILAEHGSKLWLLAREKVTPETEALVISYINAALDWVDEFGSFEVITERLIDRINFVVRVNYYDITIEVASAD